MEYVLTGGIVHLGSTPYNGHHVAFRIHGDSNQVGHTLLPGRTDIIDDNRRPRAATSADWDLIDRNAYLLLYRVRRAMPSTSAGRLYDTMPVVSHVVS